MDEKRFPKVPSTWEELVNLREYLTDCDDLFLRLEEDQKNYRNEIDSLPRNLVLRKITDQMNGEKIKIIPNIYPHSQVLQNLTYVKHYCLWSLKGALSDEIIKKIVKKEFPGKDWMHMTRKVGKFSIPEIWHAHIYIRS